MRAHLVGWLTAAVLLSASGVVHAQAAAAPDDELKTLKDRVAQLEAEIAELKKGMLGLEVQLKEKDAEVAEILQAVARRDSDAKPILALRSIMDSSEEFRKEMTDAVNESIRKQGELQVKNETGGVQFLAINGHSQRIEPLSTQTFKVPVGTLTTELVGQESAKNWTITAPNYKQEIVIRPTARQVIVNSPTVIVEPTPLYFLP